MKSIAHELAGLARIPQPISGPCGVNHYMQTHTYSTGHWTPAEAVAEAEAKAKAEAEAASMPAAAAAAHSFILVALYLYLCVFV